MRSVINSLRIKNMINSIFFFLNELSVMKSELMYQWVMYWFRSIIDHLIMNKIVIRREIIFEHGVILNIMTKNKWVPLIYLFLAIPYQVLVSSKTSSRFWKISAKKVPKIYI